MAFSRASMAGRLLPDAARPGKPGGSLPLVVHLCQTRKL